MMQKPFCPKCKEDKVQDLGESSIVPIAPMVTSDAKAPVFALHDFRCLKCYQIFRFNLAPEH